MKFKNVFKDVCLFVIGVIIILLMIMMNIATSIGVGHLASKQKEPELPIIYDSPSDELTEVELACPECGDISYGINGNVVCRNEHCPNYGLAVPASSRD